MNLLGLFQYIIYAMGGASLVYQLVKNLAAMQETQVPSLGWEDCLEKEMATHSSILAWRSPWTEKPGKKPKPLIKMCREGSIKTL